VDVIAISLNADLAPRNTGVVATGENRQVFVVRTRTQDRLEDWAQRASLSIAETER